MDLPTPEEQAAVKAERMRDLRIRHYTLELDKVAAMATAGDDLPVVIARLETMQEQCAAAYDALKHV
jgi:hypothetical protein